jgi:hypothetical protein
VLGEPDVAGVDLLPAEAIREPPPGRATVGGLALAAGVVVAAGGAAVFELVVLVGSVLLDELAVPGGVAPMLGSELFSTAGDDAVLLSPAGVVLPAIAAPMFAAADGVVPLAVAVGAELLMTEVGEPDVPALDSAGASTPAPGDAVVSAHALAISCQFTARTASSMSQPTRRVIRLQPPRGASRALKTPPSSSSLPQSPSTYCLHVGLIARSTAPRTAGSSHRQ